MRFATLARQGQPVLAAYHGDELIDLSVAAPALPASLPALLAAGPSIYAQVAQALGQAPAAARLDPATAVFLPPVTNPGKIICLGLNFLDHADESPYPGKPAYPVIFSRFASSLVGHGQALLRPLASEQFDYEGEMAVIIGKAGRHVSPEKALEYVAGYAIFNDASVRDFQFKSHQWTIGKNFDGSGGFGPAFVTADELPAGGTGLRVQTRLNGQVVQDANTVDMVFNVAETIALLSECLTLSPGDVLVMGTPAGIGLARKPPLYMKDGDVCEVEIEGLGTLRNPVRNEVAVAAPLAVA